MQHLARRVNRLSNHMYAPPHLGIDHLHHGGQLTGLDPKLLDVARVEGRQEIVDAAVRAMRPAQVVELVSISRAAALIAFFFACFLASAFVAGLSPATLRRVAFLDLSG